jgi:hypothetical protein
MAVKKSNEVTVTPTDEQVAEMERTRRIEISKNERFKDDELRAVTSFEDAMALLVQTYGGVESITDFELGNGFKIATDDEKNRLVGVSFIILHFQFNEGDYGDFVSVTLVTQHGDRIVLNDGSTGIYEQLKDVARTGRYGGIAVPHGLRKSEYDTCPDCGKPRPQSATTCRNERCESTSEKRATGATFYLDVTS